MNSVQFIGRITKDLEMKQSKAGSPYLQFTIAVRRPKDDEADFIPCVAFGKTAELIKEYVSKGSQIGVRGRLEIQNKKTENGWQTYVSCITEDITLLDKPSKPETKTEESMTDVISEVFFKPEEKKTEWTGFGDLFENK